MLKTTQLRQAVAAALLTLSGTQVALAEPELERNGQMGVNDSILTAQRPTFTACQTPPYPAGKLCAEVDGRIGTTDPAVAPIPDVDFYAFDALEGDVIMLDIDAGMKPNDLSVRSVDTTIGVFGAGPLGPYTMLRENNDTLATVPRDEGSEHVKDALIPDFRVPANGTYYVGISSTPRAFVNPGGATTNTTVTGRSAMFPNGAYKLIISGVTPAEMQVNIDIKPGNDAEAYLNPKAQGTLPVAILSNREFDALSVDQYSMTFGRNGDEKSYLRCLKAGIDVDADGRPDLVCHFDNALAGWQPDDVEGILKGKTKDGKAFKGAARLKVKQRAE